MIYHAEIKKKFTEHRLEHKAEQNRQLLAKIIHMKPHEIDVARLNFVP